MSVAAAVEPLMYSTPLKKARTPEEQHALNERMRQLRAIKAFKKAARTMASVATTESANRPADVPVDSQASPILPSSVQSVAVPAGVESDSHMPDSNEGYVDIRQPNILNMPLHQISEQSQQVAVSQPPAPLVRESLVERSRRNMQPEAPVPQYSAQDALHIRDTSARIARPVYHYPRSDQTVPVATSTGTSPYLKYVSLVIRGLALSFAVYLLQRQFRAALTEQFTEIVSSETTGTMELTPQNDSKPLLPIVNRLEPQQTFLDRSAAGFVKK